MARSAGPRITASLGWAKSARFHAYPLRVDLPRRGGGRLDHDTASTFTNSYRIPARSASASKHDGQTLRQRFNTTARQACSGSTVKLTGLRRRHLSQASP